ncbi:unnamed protein product [Caenorhabditis sp. 36 PRJEB53466]|nr:unnamed protein product [Caenorhabditis sp. 36 PRJEB53466]
MSKCKKYKEEINGNHSEVIANAGDCVEICPRIGRQAMSGRIRIRIGTAKKLIAKRLAHTLPTKNEIKSFNIDEIVTLLEDLAGDVESLTKQVVTLERCEQEWRHLEQVNPDEVAERERYVAKYQDFVPFIAEGRQRVVLIKELYTVGHERLTEMDKREAEQHLTVEELAVQLEDDMQSGIHKEVRQEQGDKQDGKRLVTPARQDSMDTNSTERNTGGAVTDPRSNRAAPTSLPVNEGSGLTDLPRTGSVVPPVQTIVAPPVPVHSIGYAVPMTVGHIQLPQMALPEFSGDILAYPAFREAFESIMGSLVVDDLTKLHYLKSVVKGEPSKLIAHIRTTQANYQLAINALDRQYGGRLRVKQVLMQQLRDLPDICHSSEAEVLQSFVIQATSVFELMISAQCDVDNSVTASLIECKLPKRIIAKIYGTANSDNPFSAGPLLERLRDIATGEMLVDSIYNNRRGDRHRNTTTTMAAVHHQHNNKRHGQPQGHRNSGETHQQRNRVDKPCAFCVEDRMMHQPKDCRKYPTADVRKERAKELRLCFNYAKRAREDITKQCASIGRMASDREDLVRVQEDSRTKAEEEANEFFQETMYRREDGRFVVRLPYCDKDGINDNRKLAWHRLIGTIKRLEKDPELLKKYGAIIAEQIGLDFLERVEDEGHTDGVIVHYLAHHPVIKMSSKSTKIRMVFDGSAVFFKTERSLNDHLHTGESLLPQIQGVMLRIRVRKILLSADIQKAFLQMELHVEDRDATRFLWKDLESGKIVCYRFKRVPFGLKSSPYLLNQCLKTLLSSQDQPIARDMARNLYVDNVYIGVDSIEEAKEAYHQSKEILKQAQMNLCQYVSNCTESNQFFAEQEHAEPESVMQKLLGVSWDTSTDEFIFSFPSVAAELMTKRKTLKIVAGIYDPQGFLTPTTLAGKLFFQQLHGSNWDEPLSGEQHRQWQTIMKNWKGDPWRIPRRLFNDEIWNSAIAIQLHVFTDASQLAFGAVAYLRILTSAGAFSQFLMAKSRVAPRKEHSIPALEMVGILCGVRAANYVIKEMDMKNRVKSILEQSEGFEFTHVPGKQNPADYLTRGLKFADLKESTSWINGPGFLQETKDLPLRRFTLDQVATTLMTSAEVIHEVPIDPHKFGSFHRMLRTIMVMLQFMIMITKRRLPKEQREQYNLTNHECATRARRIAYRWAQWIDPPSEQTIRNLRLRQNPEGIWMYQGRVEQRPLIFLPQGQISRLIVLDLHERFSHGSPLFTLAQLRAEFWIPRGRAFLKKSIGKCYGCRYLSTLPYRQPDFAAFPDLRIAPARPFENCGVDFAGPLKVKMDGAVRNIYFVLFTCLYTRFIHTAAIKDMETVTFLHTLRRMCAMFGIPKIIVADNATQFEMLNNVLTELQQQQRNRIVNSTTLPEFKFIKAHSPWAGGVYERMIGLIKRSLTRAGTTRVLMSIEDFTTVLAECTSIVNSRPLTYVASDDDITPLRPIDFVYPANRFDGVMDLSSPPDTDGQSWERRYLMEHWSQSSSITENFQRRWDKEYIQVLQERHQQSHRQTSTAKATPKVGDVVLIETPMVGRTKWPIGRIVEVKTRSAKLKKGATRRIVEYPWKLLYPLETEMNEATETTTTDETATSPNDETTQSRTPRRSVRIGNRINQVTLALTLFALFTTTTAETFGDNGTTEATGQEVGSWSTKTSYEAIGSLKDRLGSIMTSWLYTLAIFGVLLAINVAITVMRVIGGAYETTAWIVRLVGMGSQWIGRLCCKCFGRRSRQRLPTIIVALMLIGMADGCNEIASIQANENVCVMAGKKNTCYLNTLSILNVRPDGSVGCFRVKNVDHTLETFVEVQAEAIVSTCIQKSHHFTRDFDITHEYSHRCSGAGSCSGEICENLTANDTSLPEFSTMSKSAPGFSRCYKTCGCVSCGGCFWCSPSCLYSRLFAVPKSTYVYEIVTCPTWKTVLDVRVNGDRGKHRIEHGVPFLIPRTNITLVVTGFSTPPTPVHAATFIKRWKTTDQSAQFGFTYTSVAQAGTPTKGMVGEFQCATYQDALNFRCRFDENLCSCIAQGTVLRGPCRHIHLDAVLKKTLLPRSEAGIAILTEGELIKTKLTTSSLVSIQLQFRNQSIHRIVKDDNCSIATTTITGCFSCGKGALLTATCTSMVHKRIEATVKCPTIGVDFLECGIGGVRGKINFHSTQRKIEETCSISCGTVKQEFSLQGELAEEATFDASALRDRFADFTQKIGEGGIFEVITGKIAAVWSTITSWIGSGIVIMVVLVIGGVCCVQCVGGTSIAISTTEEMINDHMGEHSHRFSR